MLLASAGFYALLSVLASAAWASTDPEHKSETYITARQMSSDKESGIITASGKVEIARNGHIIHADKVTYNQNTGVVRAEGHVATLSPSGEVQFAEAEEVTGDMKEAFAENIGILFPDNSRLVARSAQRYEGRWMVADKAMYTSCNVCKENPDEPPLWQVRAQQITHDSVEHNIYYHHATVDFAGVPILYVPYLSSPDPTVERRQGLLSPTPGTTPTLGAFLRLPYYFDIAPDIDAVFAPTFSSKDKLQLGGEYRERFAKGYLQLDGSVTRANLLNDKGIDEGQQWRGHLFGHFLYNIDNVWRAGTEVAFTSDKSYLQRYRYAYADELVNRAFVEGFRGRNYGVVNSYYFEDLRPGTQPVEPLVLPQASFSALGEPGKTLGGRWSLDGSMLVTSRDNQNQSLWQQGPNTRRLSLNAGWERQFASSTGLIATLSGFVRGDSYWADNVIKTDPVTSTTNISNNVTLSRQFEQANLVARYPLGRHGDGYQQVIEPIIAITAAPVVHTDSRQPIEDSFDVEFDETNLFSPNRFTGNDLIEGGSRVTYGMRHTITTDSGASVAMFGGESYSFNPNAQFPELSGLHSRLSDRVGRIEFAPVSWFNLNYGARLDHNNFTPRRQDAVLAMGTAIFRPNVRYISAYQTETSGIVDKVEEATFGFSSTFAKYWTLSGGHTQAFQPQPGARTTSLSFTYNDECFIFGVTASHDDTSRADINAGTSVMFHFYLRNLGGIHTDSTAMGTFATQYRGN